METILLQQPWEAVQYLGTAGPETAESTRQVRSFRCKRTGSVQPHPVVNTVGPSNTTCNLSLKLRLRAQRKENRNKGGKTQGRGRRRERGGRKKEQGPSEVVPLTLTSCPLTPVPFVCPTRVGTAGFIGTQNRKQQH